MTQPGAATGPASRAAKYVRPMVSRDREEDHRTSTPLELLFDLSFVVAVSAAAASLHHELAAGHLHDGLVGYLMVFFAIWWAWMNFTWFASAYDTDDVPYRLLTLVQIAGVLVLAVGVADASKGDFELVTVGYLIMRVSLISQWLRASRSTGGVHSPAFRYAVGVAVVQVGWTARLWLPEHLGTLSFLVLVLAELAVPMVAEPRANETGWHPEHIAERYALFTIIVIGECILSTTTAIRAGLTESGVSGGLLALAGGGLLLVFGIWWLYFQRSAEEGLRTVGRGAFAWGYAHYGLFAALAGLGAGLSVASERHPEHLSATTQALAVAVPVAVALALLALMQGFLHREPVSRTVGFLVAAAAVLAIAAISAIPLGVDVLLMGVVTCALVATDLAMSPAPRSRATAG